MKQISLETNKREDTGRSANRQLRNDGQFPAILYGESGVQQLSLDAHAFQMAYRDIAGSAVLVELKIPDAEEVTFAIIQDIQRDAKSDRVLHVDFKEIVRGRDMEALIPVRTEGIAHGVRTYGGVLELSTEELNVRCRPRNLPEFIPLDVTNLEIGKSIHLREVPPLEGVTFLDDPDSVVAACVGSSGGGSASSDDEADSGEA